MRNGSCKLELIYIVFKEVKFKKRRVLEVKFINKFE